MAETVAQVGRQRLITNFAQMANTGQIPYLEEAFQYPEYLEALNGLSDNDSYVILTAASRNDLEMVRFLIRHGADPQVQDCHGRNMLTFAAKYQNPKLTELFYGKGESH